MSTSISSLNSGLYRKAFPNLRHSSAYVASANPIRSLPLSYVEWYTPRKISPKILEKKTTEKSFHPCHPGHVCCTVKTTRPKPFLLPHLHTAKARHMQNMRNKSNLQSVMRAEPSHITAVTNCEHSHHKGPIGGGTSSPMKPLMHCAASPSPIFNMYCTHVEAHSTRNV